MEKRSRSLGKLADRQIRAAASAVFIRIKPTRRPITGAALLFVSTPRSNAEPQRRRISVSRYKIRIGKSSAGIAGRRIAGISQSFWRALHPFNCSKKFQVRDWRARRQRRLSSAPLSQVGFSSCKFTAASKIHDAAQYLPLRKSSWWYLPGRLNAMNDHRVRRAVHPGNERGSLFDFRFWHVADFARCPLRVHFRCAFAKVRNA